MELVWSLSKVSYKQRCICSDIFMLRILLSKEFLSFLIVSGIAALLNFTSRIIFSLYFSYSTSIFFAFIIGLVSAFVLNKIMVFKRAQKGLIKQFLFFTLVNLIALAQTLFISLFLAEYLFPRVGMHYYGKEIAHFIGISTPILSSYLGHKYMTFARKRDALGP